VLEAKAALAASPVASGLSSDVSGTSPRRSGKEPVGHGFRPFLRCVPVVLRPEDGSAHCPRLTLRSRLASSGAKGWG